MEAPHLRLIGFSFSGQNHFQWSAMGTFIRIKIYIFITLRRLDTTWNFARSITRVSTHEHEHREHCLCRKFLNNSHYQLFFCSPLSCQSRSVDLRMQHIMEESKVGMLLSSSNNYLCEISRDFSGF